MNSVSPLPVDNWITGDGLAKMIFLRTATTCKVRVSSFAACLTNSSRQVLQRRKRPSALVSSGVVSSKHSLRDDLVFDIVWVSFQDSRRLS